MRALHVLFAVPFVGAGLWVAAHALASGQWVGVALGLVFTSLAIYGTVQQLRPMKVASAGELAHATRAAFAQLSAPQTGYRHNQAPAALSARRFYAPVLHLLPVGPVHVVGGKILRNKLEPTPDSKLVFNLVFAIVWSTLSLGLAGVCFTARQVVPALFGTFFFLVGALVWGPIAKRTLALRRLPRVEIAAEPAFLGEPLDIVVRCRFGERITRLQVSVSCREVVRYSAGTTVHSDTREVLTCQLLDVGGDLAAREHRLRTTLPGGPPSFASASNEVLWSVRVHADIPAWPDYDEHLVFRALPRPTS